MKFSISWLKRFLDTEVNVDEIINALNSLGLEVEHVIDKSRDYKDFITGLIVEVAKHPNAEKLNCCKVDIGQEVIQIVTGAHNARKGLVSIVAPVGSVIPTNKLKMEKRALRGIDSYGMMCSERELGIGTNAEGIIELSEKYKPGTKLTEIFSELDDILIDVSITPNRPDCLGVYGIARELAAFGLGKLKKISTVNNSSQYHKQIQVSIENSQDCPLFLGRLFTNTTNKESPVWLKSLLKSIGDTPISAMVDITNYISYSFARPIHVYDADSFEGNIKVRKAYSNEHFVDLEGGQNKLSENDIVVADDNKILGLAGIMGGDLSKCNMHSTNIYLEAAVFNSRSIAKTSKRLKIISDAKHIFERGVDYDFTIKGLQIASNLILEICGGEAGEVIINGPVKLGSQIINFDISSIKKISGIEISKEDTIKILTSLGFEIQKTYPDKIDIKIPTWRHDIKYEADLIEEILRLYGYDKITAIPLEHVSTNLHSKSFLKFKHSLKIKKLLSSIGYNEVITYSFMSSNIAKKFGCYQDDLVINNPISKDLDILRKSIIPNLLKIVENNNQRSIKNISIFEIGPVFNSGQINDQSQIICGIRAGETSRLNLYKDNRSIDFFDLKADVIKILQIFNIKNIDFSRGDIPSWYHPGKSACIKFKNNIIGYIGVINPSINSKNIIGFELFQDLLIMQSNKESDIISDYQIVTRDFAFIISDDIPAIELIKIISKCDLSLIKEACIFDVYKNSSIEEHKKSIGVRVYIQSDVQTLDTEIIEKLSKKIVNSVSDKINGILRILK